MLCIRCNNEIRPWGACTCCEKKLQQRIAELEKEHDELVKEVRRAISQMQIDLYDDAYDTLEAALLWEE